MAIYSPTSAVGGCALQVLKFRPSLNPSLAKFPILNNAASIKKGKSRAARATKATIPYSSIWGTRAFCGQVSVMKPRKRRAATAARYDWNPVRQRPYQMDQRLLRWSLQHPWVLGTGAGGVFPIFCGFTALPSWYGKRLPVKDISLPEKRKRFKILTHR